jgi:NADPH:quinone reductase-like Zn-dependent oxidoreductase
MKAVVLESAGGLDALRISDWPDPSAGPGEVVVRLAAAALNHRDLWIVRGLYAGLKLPAMLGSDGSGVVESVGAGVEPSLVGQRVVIDPSIAWGEDTRVPGPDFRVLGMPDDGTFAERIRLPRGNVLPVPEHLSDLEAAALPLAGLTAYRALVTRGRVATGEWVLITGIGGGVSGLALELAVALGARVLAASRSDPKLARARAVGASAVVNVTQGDWVKRAISICDECGPNLVIDSVGGELFGRLLEVVRPGGRIVNYGATTGPCPKFEIRRLFWKQIDVLGSTMGSPSEFADLLALVKRTALRPNVDSVYPLADAAIALARMDSGESFGKIVLRIGV